MPQPDNNFYLPPGWCLRYLVTSYTTPPRLVQASSSETCADSSSSVTGIVLVGSGTLLLIFMNWYCDFPTVPVCFIAYSSVFGTALMGTGPKVGLDGASSLILSTFQSTIPSAFVGLLNILGSQQWSVWNLIIYLSGLHTNYAQLWLIIVRQGSHLQTTELLHSKEPSRWLQGWLYQGLLHLRFRGN